MKKTTTFTLLLLGAFAFTSCNDLFNDNSYGDDIDAYGGAAPAELTVDSLFIQGHSLQYYSSLNDTTWSLETAPKEPTAFSSLGDVLLEYRVCYYDGRTFWYDENNLFLFNANSYDYEERRIVYSKGHDWEKDRFNEIDEAMRKYNINGASQSYLYAGVNGHARIYADKVLFGVPAGEDLNEHFVVKPTRGSRFIVTYPDYHIVSNSFEENRLWAFDECFAEGTAVNNGHALQLNEAPSETYDEITFTLEIPMLGDCLHTAIWGDDYPDDFYEKGYVRRSEPRVLQGSVTVKFEPQG